MILHDFLVVECPANDVAHALLQEETWLSESASNAHVSAEQLQFRIGPGGPRALVAKTVDLHIGEPIVDRHITTLPILWEATAASSLFPRLDGSLEISPLGAQMTQLTLYARYDPPFGKFGESVDRLVLHHLAEHTIRAFLHEVAERLSASVGHGAGTEPLPSTIEVPKNQSA